MEPTGSRRYSRPMKWFTLLVLGSVAFVFGQAAATSAEAVNGVRSGAPAPARQIGLGDELRVEVFGNPDLTTSTYVSESGFIELPLIGEIEVRGASPADAGRRIANALRDGEFLVNPHVTVTLVQEYQPAITIAGEVGNPGRYEINLQFTVLDALALAGGISQQGSHIVHILRTDAAGVQRRIEIEADLTRATLDSARPSAAVAIVEPGDVLLVPKSTFTITGHVAAPGEYRIESGMLLYQAIARAGGLTPLGSASRVEFKRLDAEGKPVKVKAREDTQIQPGDVIRIKERLF